MLRRKNKAEELRREFVQWQQRWELTILCRITREGLILKVMFKNKDLIEKEQVMQISGGRIF